MVATLTVDITIEGKTVSGTLKVEGHRRHQFETTLEAGGVFRAAIERRPDRAWGKPAGGEGPSRPGLDDNEWHVSGVINENKAEVSIDGSCNFQGQLTRE